MSEKPNPSECPLGPEGQAEIAELVRLNRLMREYDPGFLCEAGRVKVGYYGDDRYVVKVSIPKHLMYRDRECVGSDTEKVTIALIKEMISLLADRGINVQS